LVGVRTWRGYETLLRGCGREKGFGPRGSQGIKVSLPATVAGVEGGGPREVKKITGEDSR
jgi:hypothetical protein